MHRFLHSISNGPLSSDATELFQAQAVAVGERVGLLLGDVDGDVDGDVEGNADGEVVGDSDGDVEGEAEGETDGLWVGDEVGGVLHTPASRRRRPPFFIPGCCAGCFLPRSSSSPESSPESYPFFFSGAVGTSGTLCASSIAPVPFDPLLGEPPVS